MGVDAGSRRRKVELPLSSTRSGGVPSLIETLTQAMLAVRPEIDPIYLLKPGELREAFADWRVIAQRERWLDDEGWQRAVASLVVQRP